jgi:hypothetical protein
VPFHVLIIFYGLKWLVFQIPLWSKQWSDNAQGVCNFDCVLHYCDTPAGLMSHDSITPSVGN